MKTVKVILSNYSSFSIMLMLLVSAASAQTESDALRYSQTNITGTARSTAMGGAFGALGADFSSLTINPAGMGFYRKSEMSLTPSVFTSKTNSSYLGNNSSEQKFNFNFGNLGLVIATKPRNADQSGWQGVNLGIGFNRINNFNFRSSYSGVNNSSSLLDTYLQSINAGSGTNPSNLDGFGPNLAYQTYLINPIDTVDTTHYTSEIPFGGTLQQRTVTSSGALNEIAISLASNYKNRLYLGATLGIVSLSYRETTNYQESDSGDSIPRFKAFSMNQDLRTNGTGYNLKLGAVFRATDWMRLGASVHTPTVFSMTDTYSTQMNSEFDNGNTYSYSSPDGSTNYYMNTPLRAVLSAAFLIEKQGSISVDYERVNYSETRFSPAKNYFGTNTAIENDYTSASNLHVGGEWKWEEFSFRGGYAYYGSPFKKGVSAPGADFSRMVYSAGLGIRNENYFIDFAYSFSESKEFYRPYSLVGKVVDGSNNKVQSQSFMMTLGYKF